MQVISVSIDDDLLEKFDEIREQFQNRSRSEAIRDAIHFFIEDREKWENLTGTGTFVITAVYREKYEIQDKIFDIVEEATTVKSTLQYKEHGTNILVIVAGGEVEQIKNLYLTISTTKDVDYTHYQKIM